MSKQKFVVKFRSAADANQKLTVTASQGKANFNVHVTLRQPGAKAATGCHATYATWDEAKAKAEAFAKDAADKGWVRRVRQAPKREDAFSVIPTAPGAPTKPEKPASPRLNKNAKKAEQASAAA